MIFFVDDDFNAACGKTLEEAYKVYQESYGMNATSTLKVYEGIEMQVTYLLTPKVKGKVTC